MVRLGRCECGENCGNLSSANSFDEVWDRYKDNPLLKEISNDLLRDQCYSCSTILIEFIENIIGHANQDAFDISELEEDNRKLEQALDTILNVCDLWHHTHPAFPDLSRYRKLLKDKT